MDEILAYAEIENLPNYTTPTRLSKSRQAKKIRHHRGLFLPNVDTKEAFDVACSRYCYTLLCIVLLILIVVCTKAV